MNMSKRSYEALDLAILTLVASVFEGVCVFLLNKKSTSDFFLSLSAALGLIAIFRWGIAGIGVAPIAGAVGVLVRVFLLGEQSISMWLSYTLGYFGLAVVLLFFMKGNKPKMEGNLGWMALYYGMGCLGMEIVRALSNLGNHDFLKNLTLFIAFDLLNIVLGAVVFFLAYAQKTLVVDMNAYLERTAKEKKELSEARKAKKANPKINYEELASGSEINEAALLDGGTLTTEDLRELERNRREIEGEKSRFDQENDALRQYQESKKTQGGKKE